MMVDPLTSNSTSQFGNKPVAFRISIGMVTCPLLVTFMIGSLKVLLAKVLLYPLTKSICPGITGAIGSGTQSAESAQQHSPGRKPWGPNGTMD
jgi:hypothetical protein